MTTKVEDAGLTHIITFRVTEVEHLRLTTTAQDRDITLSALVRASTLDLFIPPPRPPRIEVEAVCELRRIGVLLNQCMRFLHSEKSREEKQWTKALVFLSKQLTALQQVHDHVLRMLS